MKAKVAVDRDNQQLYHFGRRPVKIISFIIIGTVFYRSFGGRQPGSVDSTYKQTGIRLTLFRCRVGCGEGGAKTNCLSCLSEHPETVVGMGMGWGGAQYHFFTRHTITASCTLLLSFVKILQTISL